MNLELKPGEAIKEIELSNVLGVSRTPLREALVQLIEEKLIVVFPQKGSFVSKIDLDIVEEAIFVRELCESEILKLACKDEKKDFLVDLEKNLACQEITEEYGKNLYEFFDLDNEFHYILFKYFNKKNSWKAIQRLSTHYDRLRLLEALEQTNLKTTLKQHFLILEVIKSGNSKEVKELVKEHLTKYTESIKLYKEKYPNYFK